MTSSVVGDTFFGLDLTKFKANLMGFRRSISKRILLLDFDASSVTFAEAQVQDGAINFAHVRRLSLPEDALERGVPAEPRKMAGLIKGFCEECDIPAHRAAVVIPHDAVFTTVLSLPSLKNGVDALEYLLDPASAAQVPVQLDQMDADLIPLGIPGKLPQTQSYFLIAIPRKLVDRVVDTLQFADMDLLQLQVGISSQLQHCDAYLRGLNQSSAVLHLELSRDTTLAALLVAAGPVRLSRLTSIRDFPDPSEKNANPDAASSVNTEAQIIHDDSYSYLPLTDLDLRRLAQEIESFLRDCADQYPQLKVSSVLLSGVNSAHPMVDRLLQDRLRLPVYISRPMATEGVGLLSPDAPITLQSLGRLVGLGLSFLPASEQSPPHGLHEHSSDDPAVMLPDSDPIPVDVKDETLYRPHLSPELLLTGSQVADPIEADELISSVDPEATADLSQPLEPDVVSDNPQALVFALSEQSVPMDSLLAEEEEVQQVYLSETEASASAVIFSLGDSLGDDDGQETVTQEPFLSEQDSSIHLEEGQDEVPFSMEDLMSSFEMNASGADEEVILSANDSAFSAAALDAEVYLADDPAMWPSISKGEGPPDDDESIS